MFLHLHWRQAIAFLKVLLIFFFWPRLVRNNAPRSYITCYLWTWVTLKWLLHDLQLDDIKGADFENSLNALGQSEKRWVSLMYNNNNYQFLKGKEHSASSESCSLVWQSNSLFSKLVIFSHVFVPLSKYVSEDQKHFARQKLGCFPLCQKSISSVPFYQCVSLTSLFIRFHLCRELGKGIKKRPLWGYDYFTWWSNKYKQKRWKYFGFVPKKILSSVPI